MTTTTATVGFWPGMESNRATKQCDEALVERTRSGDTEAFSELVRRHEHTVYNVALRFMRNPSLAEDMAQEAFLKAYRKIGRFRGDAQFSTWLYRITCNVCLSELQKRKRRGELAEHAAPASFESYTKETVQAEEAERIRQCVAQLPKKYAEVITLYYLQECSYTQVAKIMDVPEGTLKTWMHRARNLLRGIVARSLKEEHED